MLLCGLVAAEALLVEAGAERGASTTVGALR